MKDGFVRVGAATPAIRVGDCAYNAEQVLQQIKNAPSDTSLLVFPELCLTGYTCGDLFLQPALLRAAEQALHDILSATVELPMVLMIGVPVACGAALYNCAAVCQNGVLLGLVPKTSLPTYSEFYEGRHFTPAPKENQTLTYAGQQTPFGSNLLFACRSVKGLCIGVELCEDVWVNRQPSQALAEAGATVIANLSASDEAIGKDDFRRQLVMMQSARQVCAYIYADAGEGESTTDLVFAGHDLIGENGVILTESERFTTGVITTEIDVERLLYERRRLTTFTVADNASQVQTVWFDLPIQELTLTRAVVPLPFVPLHPATQQKRCEDILTIQAQGLAKRMAHTHSCAVLGLSGGLDSALALMVTVRACDILGLDHAVIHAVTMPCFGTTGRTLNNACQLARACGATLHEIRIGAAVEQHLRDIEHSGACDVTYENAQARERTQVLMDLANRFGGMVIGTGDMSELALGWATYNGDHMSMYGVNASVPKTLVRHLTAHEAKRYGGKIEAALLDILDTPVSPELLPPKDGEISQKTEELVGPYELHDFFLYYFLRFGYPPRKILRLARVAFAGKYDDDTIRRWLVTFLHRFFAQQFKRSCLPDGPRIGSVALSPRGDWRMPSDASVALWLTDLEK